MLSGKFELDLHSSKRVMQALCAKKVKMNLDFIETPNQAILACARSYLLSAELIEKQDAQLELGAILCSSFSIELLLKSLLSNSSPQNIKKIEDNSFIYNGISHKTEHGHNYIELFKKLTPTHSSYLSNIFNLENEPESLESILESYDDTFIKWRYGYEKMNKSINVTKLLLLNRKLYDAISNLEVEYKLRA
ncbi:hypothetical protein [Aliivibrio fischeri]|uniref:hypothetical protein n=1 Tax=Aliivibrio fischeri TaxID=668 RepID=UPI000907E62F|nr:hypothetical protein [Aliivibrio fischeri]